jgi:Putative prokaryotic signal transducing protein
MDPAAETRRLSELYANMSEGELESIAATAFELTEEAEVALRDEIRRRNLAIQPATEPPGYDAPDPHELVTIRTYAGLAEAMFARSLLEGAGVECFLTDENTFRINWLYTPMLGGMRLQVRAADVEDAAALLDTPQQSADVEPQS